jgi:hypothetical protein
MPSDCQCSTNQVETRVVKEVLNNKQATARLRRLEKEVGALKEKNSRLEMRLRKANISKKKILSDLKSHLNKM